LPIDLLPFAAPLALLISAAMGFATPHRRPRILPRLAEAAALVAIVVAAMSAAWLILRGAGDSRLIGLQGVGLSIRLDAVSAVMILLVSFIGWVVVRYAATYLDGEARQGAFTGWLCMTLASVLLLVLSGNW
jgi:NADH:ubiquinone oxidoreductase subunit 5 (subunit L)/multisubunit Na+/H+ antiporter MnhA subunit